MPHGVLFRSGAEGSIRRRIIEDDLLDTVIGLGPNLFYGTGIPAAILILRAKGSKPPERLGKVLFINADRDYGEGRAQNYLRPRDEEKITATYRNFADVDGFARVVTLGELADNRFQLQHPPLRRQLPTTRTSRRACSPPRRGTGDRDSTPPRTYLNEPVSTLTPCSPTAATATQIGATPQPPPMAMSAAFRTISQAVAQQVLCQSMAPMVDRHRRTHAPPTPRMMA